MHIITIRDQLIDPISGVSASFSFLLLFILCLSVVLVILSLVLVQTYFHIRVYHCRRVAAERSRVCDVQFLVFICSKTKDCRVLKDESGGERWTLRELVLGAVFVFDLFGGCIRSDPRIVFCVRCVVSRCSGSLSEIRTVLMES